MVRRVGQLLALVVQLARSGTRRDEQQAASQAPAGVLSIAASQPAAPLRDMTAADEIHSQYENKSTPYLLAAPQVVVDYSRTSTAVSTTTAVQ